MSPSSPLLHPSAILMLCICCSEALVLSLRAQLGSRLLWRGSRTGVCIYTPCLLLTSLVLLLSLCACLKSRNVSVPPYYYTYLLITFDTSTTLFANPAAHVPTYSSHGYE